MSTFVNRPFAYITRFVDYFFVQAIDVMGGILRGCFHLNEMIIMKILYFGPIAEKGKPAVGGFEAANQNVVIRARGIEDFFL